MKGFLLGAAALLFVGAQRRTFLIEMEEVPSGELNAANDYGITVGCTR